MERRAFLQKLWRALAGLTAAAAAVPPLLFWWRPPRSDADSTDDGGAWLDLGSVSKISKEGWVSKTVDLVRTNRWRRESARERVYLKRDGDDFQVLSSICPHTGCLVRLKDDGFTCPCHKSFFDATGKAVDGPSPRDLDPLPWKIEKRRLKVRYQRFRPGVAERKAVTG